MKLHLLVPLLLSLLFLCSCGEGAPSLPATETDGIPTQGQTDKIETDMETDLSSEESVCLHAFGEWETKTAAQEGIAGEEERFCFLCGEAEIREIPALPSHVHNYTETVYLPDCTEDGFTEKSCACGHTVNENIIKASGHIFGEWTVLYAPTVERPGLQSHRCSACGEMETQTTTPLPPPPETHRHEYTVTSYNPTCKKDGYLLHSCSCGDYVIEEGAKATGHNFANWYRILEPGLYGGLDRSDCPACGEIHMRTVSPPPPEEQPPTGSEDEEKNTDNEEQGFSSSGSSLAESPDQNDTDTPPDLPTNTITYFSQRDSRWGNEVLGCGIMKNNGCGPSAIAMAMSYYGIDVTPLDVAEWLYEHTIEFNHDFHGISGSGLQLGLEHYNRKVVPIQSYAQFYHHLKAGAVVVGCHGQGFFVSKPENSHCVTMIGIDENDNVQCYDPYTPSKNGLYNALLLWEERSELEVDLRLDGITHYAVY